MVSKEKRTLISSILQESFKKSEVKVLENEIYLLSKDNCDNYIDISYQVFGMILTDKKFKYIIDIVKNNKLTWNSPIYGKVRERISELDDYIVKPFEVVDGVVKCPKCSSMKTWSIQRQTRGGDEPMTTFSRCALCEYNWKYSG